MSEEYHTLLNDFYELKKKYDKNFDRLKKKIKNNSELTREQKKDKIQGLRPKCIKCKKPVGTIFEIKQDSLRAICGATNPQMTNEGYKPCSLNINIKKPITVNLEEEIQNVRTRRNELMQAVTLNKVKLLYTTENDKQIVIVEKIEELKKDYRTQCELLERYIKKNIELTENTEEANALFLKAHEIGKEIIGLIKEKQTKEAVEMYIDAYLPTISNETSVKYKHIYIEKDSGDLHYLKEIAPENSLDIMDIERINTA
jgi:hypothetical protein